MPIVAAFAITLIWWILALWVNIRILKKRLPQWTDTQFAAVFVFSIASFDRDRKELWTRHGFSEAKAEMILKQQLMCLFELPIGFVVGGVVSAFLAR